MQEQTFLVKMNAGKVEEFFVDLGPLDERCQFALKASAHSWRKDGLEKNRGPTRSRSSYIYKILE